ncbi:carboxypeptidase-like regulatory domain-containing protein [Psychroflexus montanilacus]|uniref:carboxypeptidase-like regulatory domain-containing protein n=1 Tax=Psychroflexus montanilacus TaxID=2873598 RepID=UPI001CCFCF5C|nr:carboxypeptidase-like regulatory domain-containing protein [Psychroflexus montanilacus]MBZ9651282.1 carboxypeptidase-like regulatory domain-containing protein [Psychroflexus montanilacus]
MKKILFLIMIFPSLLMAQETLMKGRIYADSIGEYQVNIINIDQQIGSVSNTKGNYEIKARVGDSILFTSLQHRTYTIKVDKKNLENDTSIFLELQVNELPEVTLNQYNLSGDLTKDIDKVKVNFVDQRQFGFGVPRELEKIDRELYISSTGMLTPLIYAITGETKRLKQRKANATVRSNQIKIMRQVSSDLITKDLKIPEKYIEDFAYFCAEDLKTMSIVNKNDPLALIDELKLKAIAYLKLKETQE